MTAQPIKASIEGDVVTMPRAEFERLVSLLEEANDVAAYDQARRRLALGEDELVPAVVADRLLAGGNPVRVWRTYRGLSVDDLAAAVGVQAVEIVELEAGGREPGLATLKAVAAALGVSLDDLV